MAEKFILAIIEKEGKYEEILIPYKKGKEIRQQLAEEGWSIRRATTVEKTPEGYVGRRIEQYKESEFKEKKPKEEVTTIISGGKAVGVSKGVAEKLEKEVIPRQKFEARREEQIKKNVIIPKSTPKTFVSTTTVATSEKFFQEREKKIFPVSSFVEEKIPNIPFASSFAKSFVSPITSPLDIALGGIPARTEELINLPKGTRRELDLAFEERRKRVSKEQKEFFMENPLEAIAGVAGTVTSLAVIGKLSQKPQEKTEMETFRVKKLTQKEMLKPTEGSIKTGKVTREVELIPAKPKPMEEGLLKFDFVEKEFAYETRAGVAGVFKRVEIGKGIAGRESFFTIPSPKPTYPYQYIGIEKAYGEISLLPTKTSPAISPTWKYTEYTFPKPTTIEEAASFTFLPPTKQLTALKPFTATVTPTKTTPIIPFVPISTLTKPKAKAETEFPSVSIKEKPSKLIPRELIEIGYEPITMIKRKEATTQIVGISTLFGVETRRKTFTGTKLETKLKTELGQEFAQDLGLRQAPISKQVSLFKPAVKSISKTGLKYETTPFTGTTPIIGGGFGGSFIKFPKVKAKEITREFGIFKPTRPPTGYKPSLTGIAYGLTIPKAPKGLLTGIELRAVVTKRKKKKKRR